MARANNNDDLTSFDVPTTTRSNHSGPTLYKIVLQVIPRDITKNGHQIVYWRRYSDIRKLYEVLQRYHVAIFRPDKFPDFPEKARFMERFDEKVVETRRLATKELLNFALQRLYLRTHDAYLKFFENGEKVLQEDIPTAVLQPQNIAPVPEMTTKVDVPVVQEVPSSEPVNVEKRESDDFLLNLEEKNEIQLVSQQSARILEDLLDLESDQQQAVEETKQEFEDLENQIDQVTQLLSMPFEATQGDQ